MTSENTHRAQKRNTKVILKGMNPSVHRILKELGILEKIWQDNIVKNGDNFLAEGISA